MAEIIRVSVPEMEAAVTKYEAAKGKQQVAYLQMSNAIREMDGFYDGPASEAFKAAFQALYRNLETSTLAMEDAITELKTSAELFRDAEDKMTSASSNLDAGSAWSV